MLLIPEESREAADDTVELADGRSDPMTPGGSDPELSAPIPDDVVAVVGSIGILHREIAGGAHG